MRSRFAAIWVVLTALIAGIAAYIAYGAGVATKIATSDGAAAAVPPPYYYGYYGHPFFGFGFFGLFFILLILFFIFGGRRGWGYRHGGMHGMQSGIEDRLESWHKRAHGEDKTAE